MSCKLKEKNFHTSLFGYLKSNNHGMVALMFDGNRDLFRGYCLRHNDMASGDSIYRCIFTE